MNACKFMPQLSFEEALRIFKILAWLFVIPSIETSS